LAHGKRVSVGCKAAKLGILVKAKQSLGQGPRQDLEPKAGEPAHLPQNDQSRGLLGEKQPVECEALSADEDGAYLPGVEDDENAPSG